MCKPTNGNLINKVLFFEWKNLIFYLNNYHKFNDYGFTIGRNIQIGMYNWKLKKVKMIDLFIFCY